MNTIPTIMAKHGLTVETLAPELGMSVRVLTGRLSGRTDWKLSEMVKLLRKLKSLGGEYTIAATYFLQERNPSQRAKR